MRLVAFILAIICIVVAAMYFVLPAGSLPSFVPGYEAGSAHFHMKHGIVAAVAAVVLFGIGWLVGRSR